MEEEKFYTIILRHDDSTKWMINDPILALGEYGVEDDTHRIKRGDGNSKWSELHYEHFGLEYLITYANLQGEVSDNVALQNALDAKVDKSIFEDIQNTIISGLLITSEEGKIGKLTKTTKDVVNGTVKQSQLLIQSEDQSIQGIWSIDETGMKILDLRANAAIDDYEPKRRYSKDHICFYDNKLYRALEDFEAGMVFNPEQWVILASLHADDIRYDNKISGLESKTVKKAIDELKDLDSEKLQMTRRPYKVYGTNEDGEQMLYDKDELRTVDSVNGIEANPETKNIQIDAKGINYDDEAEVKQTIKEVLDSKVDKAVAGKGAKIVRNVTIGYDEVTGQIKLVEDKVSLEDGSSEEQSSEVNVASNTELYEAKKELQANLDATKEALDTRITENVDILHKKIDQKANELDNKITTLDETVNNRIDNEVDALNETISTNKADIETKLTEAETRLKKNIDINDNEINARVTNEVQTLNTRIDNEVETLNTTIAENKTDIETKLTNEVKTLNQTIDINKVEVNARIDSEVATLNTTISNNKVEINDKVDANKADIEAKLEEGLNTKIDKNIADSILVGIGVSTEPGEKLDEPTLKIVAKNTDTKTEIVKHIHFAEKGSINVTKENDHIVVDSRDIDLQVKNNKEAIEANDVEINALQEHDLIHDKELATHASQIANHETRMLAAEESIVRIDETIEDLTEKHENDITAVNTVNADQEAHLTRIDLTLDEHDERINENASSIIETNKNVSKNLESINNLQETKLDRNFAVGAGDRVTANIQLQELSGTILADAKLTGVVPTTKEVLTKNFILKSSDNTLVSKAITDDNGTVVGYDLATNLDTDVNYWITTEIISTTIPSETVLDIAKLTSTTKSPIELQDIVSDPEGTWARVQEIDNEANTITVVTFHKHAQAVWGTVKGDIADQTDLQEEFALRDERNATHYYTYEDVSTGSNNGIMYSQGMLYLTLYNSKDEAIISPSYAYMFNSPDIKFWKEQGLKSLYLKVESEKVDFDTQESGLTSTTIAPAIRELKALDDEKVLITDFETFKTTNTSELDKKIDKSIADYLVTDVTSSFENGLYKFKVVKRSPEGSSGMDYAFVTVSSPNNDITLVGSPTGVAGFGLGVNAENVLIDTTDTTLTETKLTSIIRELDTKVENGVKTVNNKAVDENKNITIAAEDMNLSSDPMEAVNVAQLLRDLRETISSANREYEQGGSYTINSLYNQANFVFYTHTGSGVTLMGRVMKNFTADTTKATVFESFQYDVEQGNISLVGIPEQIEEDDEVIEPLEPVDPSDPDENPDVVEPTPAG